MLSLINWGKDESGSGRTSSLGGWLWKMKRGKRVIVPQWNKRWFSIEGKSLLWYEQPNSEEASGSCELVHVDGIRTTESGPGIFGFVVSHPTRTLILRASSHQERSKWMRALQFQTDLAKGGNGQGIVCESPRISSREGIASAAPKKVVKGRTLEDDLDIVLRQLSDLECKINSKVDVDEELQMSPRQQPSAAAYRHEGSTKQHHSKPRNPTAKSKPKKKMGDSDSAFESADDSLEEVEVDTRRVRRSSNSNRDDDFYQSTINRARAASGQVRLAPSSQESIELFANDQRQAAARGGAGGGRAPPLSSRSTDFDSISDLDLNDVKGPSRARLRKQQEREQELGYGRDGGRDRDRGGDGEEIEQQRRKKKQSAGTRQRRIESDSGFDIESSNSTDSNYSQSNKGKGRAKGKTSIESRSNQQPQVTTQRGRGSGRGGGVQLESVDEFEIDASSIDLEEEDEEVAGRRRKGAAGRASRQR